MLTVYGTLFHQRTYTSVGQLGKTSHAIILSVQATYRCSSCLVAECVLDVKMLPEANVCGTCVVGKVRALLRALEICVHNFIVTCLYFPGPAPAT